MNPLIIGVMIGVYWWWRSREDARREDMISSLDPESQIDPSVGALEESLGWPYYWGRGSPSTPWADGAAGVDCSGYAQMAQVKLGLLSASAPDRSAAAMADACDPVAIGDQVPGDLVYYPGHVMVVCSYPGEDGHSAVIGASGGGSSTKGDDPGACVKVFDTALYRNDFSSYMRWKS